MKNPLSNITRSLEIIEWYEGLSDEERDAISDEKAEEVLNAYVDYINLEVIIGARGGCLLEFEEDGLTAGRLISQEEKDYIDRTGKLPFKVPEEAKWRFAGETEWHEQKNSTSCSFFDTLLNRFFLVYANRNQCILSLIICFVVNEKDPQGIFSFSQEDEGKFIIYTN